MFCRSSLQTGTWSCLLPFHETHLGFSSCHVSLHWDPAHVLANTQLSAQRPDVVGTSTVKSNWEQHVGSPQKILRSSQSHHLSAAPSESTNSWQSSRPNFKAGNCKCDSWPKNTSEAHPTLASLLRFSCFRMGYMGGLHCDRGERMSTLISSSGSILLITCKLWLRQLVS